MVTMKKDVRVNDRNECNLSLKFWDSHGEDIYVNIPNLMIQVMFYTETLISIYKSVLR
jgi:hypothetical protein